MKNTTAKTLRTIILVAWTIVMASMLVVIQKVAGNVEQQKTAVAQQIAKFKEDIAGIDHQIKAMQPTLVRATAQGNSGDLERIQEKLTDYEARKAALAAQIQLLQSAPIKGSRELVKAADAKEPVVKAPARSSESELDIMVED